MVLRRTLGPRLSHGPERLPARIARAYRRFRRAPGAFKIDFAVEGGVPWTNEACRRAGTVHLGGTFAERHAARYFIRYELPRTEAQLDLLAQIDRTTVTMDAAWF